MTPTEALTQVLEADHQRMTGEGYDCCADCAEDWPCPTAILTDAIEQGAAIVTVKTLADALHVEGTRCIPYMCGPIDHTHSARRVLARLKEMDA